MVLSILDRLIDEKAVQVASLEAVHGVARVVGGEDLWGCECVEVSRIGFVLATSVSKLSQQANVSTIAKVNGKDRDVRP